MPRMNIRGLCVCSFGLRTIAVLMSLFPSLGISSFHTAVCCDGENEYTTLHAPCQPFLAFFFDFFCGFFLPPRYAGRQYAASLFCVRGALASGFFFGRFFMRIGLSSPGTPGVRRFSGRGSGALTDAVLRSGLRLCSWQVRWGEA